LPFPSLTLNRTPIVEAGAFSAYAGFERFLVVIEGDLTLRVDDTPTHLERRGALRFSGAAATSVVMGDRPAEVFNLIADQSCWRVAGAVVANASDVPATEGVVTIVHVAEGSARLNGRGTIGAGDTVLSRGSVTLDHLSGWVVLCRLFPLA